MTRWYRHDPQEVADYTYDFVPEIGDGVTIDSYPVSHITDDLEAVDVAQPEPGKVVVRLAYTGTAPHGRQHATVHAVLSDGQEFDLTAHLVIGDK